MWPATPGSVADRVAVLASSVSPSGNGMKGFGAASRESGHNRVPAPPDKMIGTNGMAAFPPWNDFRGDRGDCTRFAWHDVSTFAPSPSRRRNCRTVVVHAL